MKKVTFAALIVVLAIGIGMGKASAAEKGNGAGKASAAEKASSADNDLAEGSMSLHITTAGDQMIIGKYGLSHDMAILAGIALNSQSGGGSSATNMQFFGGLRMYLKAQSSYFFPYVEGGVLVSSLSSGGSSSTSTGLLGNFGAEYFFDKLVSVEGSAGVSLSSASSTTVISTQRMGLGLNFYF